MAFLLQWLEQFGTWLYNFLRELPLLLLNDILSGFLTMLSAIPAPAFFADIASYVGGLPPLAAFLITSLQIPAGITIACSAFLIRFLLRRFVVAVG